MTDERAFDNWNYNWSGSKNDGTPVVGYELGAAQQDGQSVPFAAFGSGMYYGNSAWVSYSTNDQTYLNAFYAISGTYATTTDTPEPLSAALLASGLAVLAAARKRRAARA